jgi:hypothetical protein
MENLFKLNQDYNGWEKGTIVLLTGKITDLDSEDFGKTEYEDIGYELKNGWGIGYSQFDIPTSLLSKPSQLEESEVKRYLSNPFEYKNCTIEIITSNK